jgi:hypothetical protein
MGTILGGSFKGLSPSTTPFGKRKARIVGTTIPEVVVLSIPKVGCENYLFRSQTKIVNC